MSVETENPVVFCGAGPGDPELITVKGQKALQQADLVVFAGSLVPRQILDWAPDAETIDSSGLNLEQIVGLMIEAYHRDLKVVRLHTGDPSLYGAIAEQIRQLEARGIPCRIIPGVTAAFAAAAALGLEYTIPEICQSLILTRASGRTLVPPAEALENMAAHKTSMAVYLSAGLKEKVASALQDAYGPDFPCAVVYRSSWPDEKIIRTTCGRLEAAMDQAGVNRQALIIVSPALLDATGDKKSRLYAKTFSHGFRKAASGRKKE